MRRIENDEQRQARQKRNQRILSILLLGILVLSSIGYAFTAKDPSTSSSSSGQLSDGRWQVILDNQQFVFSYPPKQVESIQVVGAMPLQYYASSTVYVSSNGSAINYELGNTLGRYVRLVPACLGVCEDNLPEKNCSDVVIVWNQSLENKVYSKDNCIFIEGDLKAVDAFLYKVFGIN